MDRFDAMQVLLAVVDEGSLSAGARKLRAPLQTVSRKVAELERHLGTRLLIRTSRNIQLTDAGLDYVDVARRLVADLREAELRASGEYERPRGELKLTATVEFGRIIVLPLAYEFLREQPEITLNYVSTNRFVDLVQKRVDVGIRVGDLHDNSLIAVKIGSTQIVTCASPDYLERRGCPRCLEDLGSHDRVQFGNITWPSLNPTAAVHPNIRVNANDVGASAQAAVNGLGITRAPSYLISEEIRAGALVEILSDYAPDPLPVHMIYVKQGLLPLKVRVFVDWMVPRMRAKLREIEETCDRLKRIERSPGPSTIKASGGLVRAE
jgi:DNA-binding transcriptional LysR family regulator